MKDNILNNIESNEKIIEVLSMLIDDENEAIRGYEKSFDELRGIVSEEQAKMLDEKFLHIINEEEEHIEEIKEIASKLGVELK